MKAVIQRVTQASVEVEGKVVGQIRSGLLVLLGVARGDTDEDLAYLAEKIPSLRIFNETDITVECGVFAAHMKVSLINDGPVTFILDSRAS